MTKNARQHEGVSRNGLTRRVVAGGTLFGLAGWFGARAIGPSLDDAETAILQLLRHEESASHIGHLALASRPEMADRGALLTQLLDDLRLDVARATRASADMLGLRLTERIRNDFAELCTISLDGWLLSLTEVRLCALAALNNARTRL